MSELVKTGINDFVSAAEPTLPSTPPTRLAQLLQRNKPEVVRTNVPVVRQQRIAADRQSTSRRSRWTSQAVNPLRISDPPEKDPLTDQRLDGAQVRRRNWEDSDRVPVRWLAR